MIGAFATVVGAIIGFAGGVIGQQLSTERAIRLERLDNITSLRSETYVDFFSAMARFEQARQFGYESYEEFVDNKPENDELAKRLETTLWGYHEETKEARMRLAAFAPTELVHALADYYRERFTQRPCHSSWERDVVTYLAMRKELLAGIEKNDVSPEQMFLLMWNCNPLVAKGGDDALGRE